MTNENRELRMEELEAVNGCGDDFALGGLVRTLEISTGGTAESSKPVASQVLTQGVQTAAPWVGRVSGKLGR